LSTVVGQVVKMEVKEPHHFSVTRMLYVLGATIAIVGIVIFVSQIWQDIASSARIAITLGLGFLMAMIGSVLLKQRPDEHLGTIFHFMGGMLIPGGTLMTLHEMGVDFSSMWPVAISFGIIFVFYVLLNLVHKNQILTFLSVANGTMFTYLLVEAIIGGSFYQHQDLYKYVTMVVGMTYLILGYSFRESWNKDLTEVLYFFGSLGFLGASFSQVFDSELWRITFFLIVFGGLFLSVYLKSRSILLLSTGFLIGHVSYITGKYFADSIGWPVSLVMLGFVFIGLGYTSVMINKKYISA
jgi:positive regulator of sigma E activity